MFRRSLLVLVWVLGGCSSNNCQDLCQSFYQMELRCELFGLQQDQLPTVCSDEAEDPQTLAQKTDYAIRKCREDYRNPSTDEQKRCCQQTCYQNLLDEYEAIDGTLESDYEKQRDLCQKYRQLVNDGSASWCTTLQSSCLSSY